MEYGTVGAIRLIGQEGPAVQELGLVKGGHLDGPALRISNQISILSTQFHPKSVP